MTIAPRDRRSAALPFAACSVPVLPEPASEAPEAVPHRGVQRIDDGHAPARSVDPASGPSDLPTARRAVSPRDSWLRLHATDLISRLQAWAEELDQREARLNAWAAQQDLRERQFRTVRQSWLAELAEQRRAIERLREEVERQARQLAFALQGSAGLRHGAAGVASELPEACRG